MHAEVPAVECEASWRWNVGLASWPTTFRLAIRKQASLKHYMREATAMCEILSRCRPNRLGVLERSEINSQRMRENDAFVSYSEVRAKLLAFASAGYSDSV
jgi:hypothetical protein